MRKNRFDRHSGKNWVTYHGFALNVNTDLSFFNSIKPCGLEPSATDSMSHILGRELNITEVANKVALIFAEVFNMRIKKWVEDENEILQTSLVKS